MSAAAKPWKGQDDRDRRTKMVHSSVHAPAKKDGAGGNYTWGTAMDVQDYEPVGQGGAPKVVTAAAPVTVVSQPLQATSVCIQDQGQFPSLGSSQRAAAPVTSVRWAAPAPAVYAAPTVVAQTAPGQTLVSSARAIPAAQTVQAGTTMVAVSSPTAAATPRVLLNEDMLRPGVPALDATHPRNTFARKPYKPPTSNTAEQRQDAPAIDWTAAGTTAFQQQVIHAVAANPAHLGPYAEVAPRPPITMLQLQAAPVYIPSTKIGKQISVGPKFGKPQVMYQRKC